MPTAKPYSALRWSILLGLITLTAQTVSAQTDGRAWEGYRDVHHRNDCRLAHQILTDGQPANKRAWALRVITDCGPLGGEAVAKLLHDYRNVTERTDEYDEVVLLATKLTDRSIYEAAMELSQNPEVTELARIQSIRALYHQVDPGNFVDYETFVDPDIVSVGSTYHSSEGEPLPPDALTRIIDAMTPIGSDPEASQPLRAAAQAARAAAAAEITFQEKCGEVSIQECMRRMGVIPPEP